ncbi:hypothetical protein L2E82_01356 [Cichorium intybus]|uniref:Uncharacterized protein n=1 Tax=Cichorium intybus TaxID=13427 RepID=A0ACB9H064_CICIN|nr:hypothetical protein L2E82_01356 [Cichorium intybus]
MCRQLYLLASVAFWLLVAWFEKNKLTVALEVANKSASLNSNGVHESVISSSKSNWSLAGAIHFEESGHKHLKIKLEPGHEVLKFLMEKNSVNVLHRQVTIGTLILQDCAVGLLFALLFFQYLISMTKSLVVLVAFLSRSCLPWFLKLMISLSSQIEKNKLTVALVVANKSASLNSNGVHEILRGIVMEGSAGASMHCRFRVATDNFVFAMPDTALGLFPDVGEYVGLTGAEMLATHFVSLEHSQSRTHRELERQKMHKSLDEAGAVLLPLSLH